MYYPQQMPQVPVQQNQFQNNFQQPMQPQFNEQLYKQQNGYIAPTYQPFNSQIDLKANETMTDVYGIEGAKAYLVGAGNVATLFDNENKNIFYRKGADKSGKVNLFEIYKYEKIDEQELRSHPVNSQVDTRQDEIKSLREDIDELKQIIKQMRQPQPKKNPVKKDVIE